MNVKSVGGKKKARNYQELLIAAKSDFTLSVSNYTIKINSKSVNSTFMKSNRGGKFFAANAKIKSDVSKQKLPRVDKSKVKYFEHDFYKDRYEPIVTNIDLKNAYATVLKNKGFISEETFKYLSALRKSERLASVGMLASKKYVFEYKQGELKDYQIVTGPYENFFFYCVKFVYELMLNLKKIAGKNFLYIWVDSIYFVPDPIIEEAIKAYINSEGFNYSIDTLTGFHASILKSKVKLSYEKSGKEVLFYIPPKGSEFSENVSNFLTRLNLKQ